MAFAHTAAAPWPFAEQSSITSASLPDLVELGKLTRFVSSREGDVDSLLGSNMLDTPILATAGQGR